MNNPHAISRLHKTYTPPADALLQSVGAAIVERRKDDGRVAALEARIATGRKWFWLLQAPGIFLLGALVDRALRAWGVA